MDELVKKITSQSGKEALQDPNKFCYVNNGMGALTSRCPATLTTRNSTGSLKNTDLPEHNHNNKVMNLAAQQTEAAIVNHFATIQDTTPSVVLQQISSNMLSSDFPG